jgi:hypothetical protein
MEKRNYPKILEGQSFNSSNIMNNYSINGNNINDINNIDINNIPYAKSIRSTPNLNNNTSKSYSQYNTGLPLIPRATISQKENYQQAYDKCNQAKGLI